MKMKMSHNLSDAELEEYLEKALTGIRSHREIPRELPHRIANEIKRDNEKTYDKVINNMVDEIKRVIQKG
jgi:hypothetical protein